MAINPENNDGRGASAEGVQPTATEEGLATALQGLADEEPDDGKFHYRPGRGQFQRLIGQDEG